MLVAAEASGDALGAGLARALRKRDSHISFVGVGGRLMAAEGVESPFDIADLSVLGLFEGLAAYPKVLARVSDVAELAAREKPDIAVLIDSWGFTLRVARALRKQDPTLPLIKYVGPQVWASRPGRAKTLAHAVDHLLSILPFDAAYYALYRMPVTFVGNPSLSTDFSRADGGRFRKSIGAGRTDPILLVLPGSRRAEIRAMTAPFAATAKALKARFPGLHVVVPVASTVEAEVEATRDQWPEGTRFIEGEAAKRDAMKAATVALVCSGTATTELALAGATMVVGYKIGAATYAILKRLVTTRWIVLLNIAAGKMIVPEFVQDRCTPDLLTEAVAQRLSDKDLRAAQVHDQNAALKAMGRGTHDPAAEAAEVVMEYLGRR